MCRYDAIQSAGDPRSPKRFLRRHCEDSAKSLQNASSYLTFRGGCETLLCVQDRPKKLKSRMSHFCTFYTPVDLN